MERKVAMDAAEAARHVRFGKLPERVRFEDMTQVVESAPDAGADSAYQDTGAWRTFSCLALDLGL
ncbi:hypothetical protein [Streptomyces sp. NPDC101166]|uniref:hypothetical protein n=1 Tax=Streptomyces sp. NPDC101166 TaxID=3366120 RepID=UPI0037FF3A8E